MVIEYACELVEQIITPGCEITLIEVVADDEFLKGHFGEVGGKRAVTSDARDTDRLRRYGVQSSAERHSAIWRAERRKVRLPRRQIKSELWRCLTDRRAHRHRHSVLISSEV